MNVGGKNSPQNFCPGIEAVALKSIKMQNTLQGTQFAGQDLLLLTESFHSLQNYSKP